MWLGIYLNQLMWPGSYLHQLMWFDLKLEPVDVASNLSVPVDVVRLGAFSQLMWQGNNQYQLMWSV